MSQPNQQQPQVGIARIYVKDISFESPLAPKIFMQQWRPEIKLGVEVRHRKVQENLFEVSLELTVEAQEGEKVGFITEVEQAGLFEVSGAQGAQLEHILSVFCASTLFPYARQVVDQCLNQGGFPPVMLAPLNFEALYARQRDGGAQAPSPN